MFKTLLERMDEAVKNRTSLEAVVEPKDFEPILSSKTIQEAAQKLLAADLQEGLPSLIGRGKNIIDLFRYENWEINMVRQALFPVEPYLVSAPNPILGFCVAGEGTSKLCYYKIDGNTEALSQAHDWSLKEAKTVEIKKGDFFSCNDPNSVMDFTELSETHVFLRIVHKPVSPLLFVFNRGNKQFSYHTFSDEITTGHFFFGDLLLNMVNNPDCVQNFSEKQMAELIAFCNREIGNEDINMKARWRLLQTLGMVSETDTIKWLETFSNHPDPGVSDLAKATLVQIRGGQ